MIVPPLVVGLTLTLAIQDPGAEPPKPANIVNSVEGLTTILSLASEGSIVKKGDVIVELDSAALRDRLTNQEVVVVQMKAAVETAKSAVESAEIAGKEVLAALAQEISSAEADIRVAELDIKISEQKVNDAKAKQKTPQGRIEMDRAVSELDHAKNALNKATARRKTLREVTTKKRKLEASVELQKAIEEQKTQEQILALETKRRDGIKKQIAACTITAPIDGRIEYANPRDPRPDGYMIEEGARVRQRQVIMRIVP